jgi:hypothetical protein
LQEYKEYYAVRAQRYANNEKYRNSYEAEKKLSDAMQSCSTLDEFKTKMGNLNQLCAVALVKDQNLMENAFYNEYKEIVRAAVSERILEKVDQYQEVMDLIQMTNAEETRGMREISCDEANRIFHYLWKMLDMYEVYSMAVVPSNYQNSMQEGAEEYKNSVTQGAVSTQEQMVHWDPNFKLNPDIVMEHRHRRLLPFTDEHIVEQLQKFKKITNL